MSASKKRAQAQRGQAGAETNGAGTPAEHKAALTPITVAYGDGIGPEIMTATLKVLTAAGARVAPELIEIGERMYLNGHSSGIAPEAWESLRRTRVLLKAPITTPSGGGYKSLNVTIRKTLGLYANVRPSVSYSPCVASQHPKIDLVIIRENEEDLYAGIEHRQTDEVVQCLKLISRPGCERIIRYAFEYARAHGRKKVTCMTKDNIMKLTDGLFHQVFNEVKGEYPELVTEHMIIDIGAARLATRPERFDVIVTLNLYGDILSDIAAELTGSVGLAGSANIGERVAMFEAIHGSAPDIAGLGVANPSGLLLGAVMMLVHIGQPEVAERVHNAWLRAIEEGQVTADVRLTDAQGAAPLGCMAFAEAVIARLGQRPERLAPVSYAERPSTPATPSTSPPRPPPRATKTLAGVDVFVHEPSLSAEALAERLQGAAAGVAGGLRLQMITNRGVKVWPGGFPETSCTDHWRCRFMASGAVSAPEGAVTQRDLLALLSALVDAGVDLIKTEYLCVFDGVSGFSLGQGQ